VNSRLLGASGLRVSELCLGVGTFGDREFGADPDESARIFRSYLDAGGRFFDVANTYAEGRSEEILGALAKGMRDELVIGTKYTAMTRPGDLNSWGNHRKSLRQALDASLARLQTDYVDVLWVHAWDGLTPLDEIVRALDDEIRRGRVLYAGVSNTPAWAIARAQTLAEERGLSPFVALQTEYNLATRTAEHELLPMTKALHLSVLSWSPLAGGVLAGGYRSPNDSSGTRWPYDEVPTRRLEIAAAVAEVAAEIGRTPAEVALAWLRQRPIPVIPIIGARKLSQLEQNLAVLDIRLAPDELTKLDALSAPLPIMPGEFMDTPAAARFFDQGSRRFVIVE